MHHLNLSKLRVSFQQLLAALALTSVSFHTLAQPVLLHNVKGYGFDEQRQLVRFSQLVFDDATGKVLARGDDIAKQFPTATSLDGQGRALLPGLIDGHGHVLGLGQNLSQVELRETASEAQAVTRVAAFAKQNPQAQWILGRGWNQVLWPTQRFPSRALLDEAVTDRPVWLSRVDGHAGWANSKALALAGITKDTLDPAGGQILRDEHGEPTGVLIDNAMLLLEKHIPQQNEAERLSALNTAFNHLLSLGITSTHDAGIDAANLASYQQLRQQNQLPLRLYPMINATDPQLPAILAAGIVDDPLDFLDVR